MLVTNARHIAIQAAISFLCISTALAPAASAQPRARKQQVSAATAPSAGADTSWHTELRRCEGWIVAGATYEVAATKADGQPWDSGGNPPDVVVVVQEREKAPAWRIDLPKVQDKLTGETTATKPTPLPGPMAPLTDGNEDNGPVIATAIVSDADALSPDLIGVVPLRLKLKGSPVGQGSLVGAAGQVTALQVFVGLRDLSQCPPDVAAKYDPIMGAARCESGTIAAKVWLRAIFTAMKATYAEKEKYPTTLQEAGIEPVEGAKYVFTIKLTPSGFVATAMGDPDGDGQPDVWTIDETNNLKNTTVDCTPSAK